MADVLDIGTGFLFDGTTYNVFGEALGTPSPPATYTTLPTIVQDTDHFNPTYYQFDLETTVFNKEIAAIIYTHDVAFASPELVQINVFRDADRKLMYSNSFLCPAAASLCVCMWVGWTKGEINGNGSFYAEVVASGAYNYRYLKWFYTIGTDGDDPGVYDERRIWISGNDIGISSGYGKLKYVTAESSE